MLPVICKDPLLIRVRQEAAALLPFVRKLNQGPVGKQDVTRLKSLAYYKAGGTGADDQELEDAAVTLHNWLSTENSRLRQFLCGMSAGGLFFVAQCHEKAGRSFVVHGGGSVSAMRAAATASSSTQRVTLLDDSGGLLPSEEENASQSAGVRGGA